ncbi:DUF2523 family protein [Alcanivorax sp.]|uniref:DUF2523 family protein n=1 Tax=Alcanivorax sp. TaxID=1872427 RepID=UPI003BAC19D4
MALPVLAGIGAFIFGRTLLSVAARLLSALGIGYLVMEGVQLGFDQIVTQVKASFNGIPSDMLSLLGLSGVDKFISIVLSAHAAGLLLKGIGGTIKSLRVK